LGFLGFNIFTYLAKGEQGVNNILSPFWTYILSFFNYTPASITASSSPVETDVAASVKETKDAQPSNASVSKMNPDTTDSPMHDNAQNNALNRALNISKHQELTKQDYVANDSYDSTQQGKAGWCYIGSEQGYRSCSQVGEADVCMSGNIFPTQDVCVNPSLRA